MYPVNVAAAELPRNLIAEIIQRFTANKSRHVQLMRKLQLFSEDLAKDADLITQWGRARSCNAPGTPVSSQSPMNPEGDEINLKQQVP